MDPFKLDAREAWNAGADAFARFVDSGADYYRHLVHGPGLLAACGDVRGARALDVGCGHGFFTRQLARAGAAVTGIDLSDKLLERAAEAEAKEPLGARYLHMDAARIGAHFDEGSFDLVTGCMSLQDIADPAAVLHGAGRVLRGEGRAVFSVPHPCTDPPFREWQRDGQGRKLALRLDRYFDTGPAVCDWNMKRLTEHWRTPFRRFTITEWSAMIRDAGFLIRSLSEPRPDARAVAAHPDLEDCSRMPYFLVFEIVKPARGC
jgi:2-polyprenyl-3-methyl-5-hydroxy-6-metoxy-1,4-benzoquinol methylase